MWRRCAGAVILPALVGVALSGCASTPTRAATAPPNAPASASVSPSPSASPSLGSTPAPSPTASATPFVSAADEVGAHAFVVAYFAELNRAYATGDVSRLVPYREPTCICVRFETRIVGVYSKGGQISGTDFQVLKWAFGAHGPAFARTAVYFHVTAIRHEIPGKPTQVDAAANGYYAIDLRRQRGHWTISDIRFKAAA